MSKVFTLFGWLVFIILLLQLAGWFYFKVASVPPIGSYGYPKGLFVFHPKLGYLYRPGYRGFFRGAAYADIPIIINKQGFRDQDFVIADKNIVVAIGDSVVFGSGVNLSDRFTEKIETSDLGRQLKLDVWNMGVNGYSFGHYVELAKMGFLVDRPTSVLVGFTLNDIRPMQDSGRARRVAKGKYGKDVGVFSKARQRLGNTYARLFLREIKEQIRFARMNMDESEDYHTKWMRSMGNVWNNPENRNRLKNKVSEFDLLLKKNGTPYGVVIFPELNELEEPGKFSGPRTYIMEILSENKIPFCELYKDFKKQKDLGSLFLFNDSVHFTPKGHELVKEGILRCINEKRIPFPAITNP